MVDRMAAGSLRASIGCGDAWRPLPICAVIGGLALGLSWLVLDGVLPPAHWFAALAAADRGSMADLVFVYSALPRLVGAILAGAALGLAGALFQHALRNPLAVPDTLGVTAGAQLALAAVTLFAPRWLAVGRGPIAFAGGCAAVALVLALSWRRGLAPVSVLLTGLVITLYASALGTLLVLFHAHDLSGLLLWASGSLSVQDWSPVSSLASGLLILCALIALLRRALTTLRLDDGSVRSLGGSVVRLRTAAMLLGVALTALVTANFGSIEFVGFAAPALVRLCGVRRLGAGLVWSALVGGLMLWATDGAVALASSSIGDGLPTGAATAVLGTPLLIWLASRKSDPGLPAQAAAPPRAGLRHPGRVIAALALLLALTSGGAILAGYGAQGWAIAFGRDLIVVLPWRGPRTLAAGVAGGLLALSGFILQRVSRNPMAAPEMLGLSAGAGFGLMLALTVFDSGPALQACAAVGGACAIGAVLLLWAARRGFEPTRVLITGLALTTCFNALVSGFGATGDMRALQLMAWMTGSAYRVTSDAALLGALALLLLLPGLVLARRWLDLAPLGPALGMGFGLRPRLSGFLLYGLAALLAGCGTLTVGPLSFVGLVAPHVAARCGLRRSLPQGIGAALIGALIMVLADWAGRTLDFPWQIPSGIVAAMIGGPVLLALLARRDA